MSTPPHVVELPLREVTKTLMLDLRAYEVGRKIHRNVLIARNAIVPSANLVTEQTLTLSHATASPVPYAFQGTPGNTLTVMTASTPLRVRVTRTTGVLDLGPMTLLVLSAGILSLELTNESTVDDSDVEIIHA